MKIPVSNISELKENAEIAGNSPYGPSLGESLIGYEVHGIYSEGEVARLMKEVCGTWMPAPEKGPAILVTTAVDRLLTFFYIKEGLVFSRQDWMDRLYWLDHDPLCLDLRNYLQRNFGELAFTLYHARTSILNFLVSNFSLKEIDRLLRDPDELKDVISLEVYI